MAGHNKWSKVKHKKAITDARKSKEFSKYSQLIAAEVRRAGGDEGASEVRSLVEKAKSVNMPADNIARAIERGKGAASGALEEVVYEAYGPSGVGIIIYGLTDNRNRTSSEVKYTLNHHGASLGAPGSASWAFERAADGTHTPHTTIDISDAEAESLSSLVSALEELEDVTSVYTNAATEQA